jgi:hypothetical protein
MAAGLETRLWEIVDLVKPIEAVETTKRDTTSLFLHEGYWASRSPVISSALSSEKLASLRELAKEPVHGAIPPAHAKRLRDLDLVFMLLGAPRIATAGRSRLASGM